PYELFVCVGRWLAQNCLGRRSRMVSEDFATSGGRQLLQSDQHVKKQRHSSRSKRCLDREGGREKTNACPHSETTTCLDLCFDLKSCWFAVYQPLPLPVLFEIYLPLRRHESLRPSPVAGSNRQLCRRKSAPLAQNLMLQGYARVPTLAIMI